MLHCEHHQAKASFIPQKGELVSTLAGVAAEVPPVGVDPFPSVDFRDLFRDLYLSVFSRRFGRCPSFCPITVLRFPVA